MNIMNLMKQAQEMQKKMKKMQDEIQSKEFEGSSGGQMVKITMDGAGVAKKITLDESLIKIEDKEILEDLIVAAINDVKKKVDEESAQLMKSATSGMNLPQGLDGMF